MITKEQKPSIFPTLVNIQGRPSDSNVPEQEERDSDLLDDDIDASEQLRVLLQEFNNYDTKQLGMIPADKIRPILTSLGYPLEDLDDVIKYAMMTKQGFVTFDELLSVISQTQLNSQVVDEQKLFAKKQLKSDKRLVGFLKLLDEYRRKCELSGNYKQAKKSKIKIEEIKQKQGIRKRNFLKVSHIEELNNVEYQQRKQFEEFSHNWDKYMSQYEQLALMSLQKLKNQHATQLAALTQKVKKEIEPRLHFSKYILQLRTKQRNLVRLQQYEQAQKVRVKLEQLQNQQRAKHQVEVNETLQLKMGNLKKQQISALNALLKRIQKDRNNQLRHRQRDSQTLIVKNRNIRNDLMHKHQQELKRAVESLREFMNSTGQEEDKRQITAGGFQRTNKLAPMLGRNRASSSVKKDIYP